MIWENEMNTLNERPNRSSYQANQSKNSNFRTSEEQNP